METCDVYAAASAVPGIGMGVFAARRFFPGDTVHVSPMFLKVGEFTTLHTTVIMDYYFTIAGATIVPFGLSMVINHGHQANVKWKLLPRQKPSDDDTWKQELVFMLHYAVREIEPGEEIFEDFGHNWLESRGLEERTRVRPRWYDPSWSQHGVPRCSKLAAGFGDESIQRMIELGGRLQKPSMHFVDSGWGAASGVVKLTAGTEIESAPALLLPLSRLRGTTFGPLVFEWDHLNTTQQTLIRSLRKLKTLKMYVTNQSVLQLGLRRDIWRERDVALLPLGGISMVRRVGRESAQANCELWLRPTTSRSGRGSAGVEAVLVATTDVPKGQTLLLGLPPAGFADEHLALMKDIISSGQPMPFAFQGVRRYDHVLGNERSAEDTSMTSIDSVISQTSLSHLSECALERNSSILPTVDNSSTLVFASLRTLLVAGNMVALYFIQKHLDLFGILIQQMHDAYKVSIAAGFTLQVLIISSTIVEGISSTWWRVSRDCADRFAKFFQVRHVPGLKIITPDLRVTDMEGDAQQLRYLPHVLEIFKRRNASANDEQAEGITCDIR